jgi:hypothetical protein
VNRQALLDSIQRHLCDLRSESESVRSLSEIVSLVAQELRRESKSDVLEPPVIPVGIVAAFVDGVVTDEESHAVLEAARADNSVIAELVAAVLAKKQSIEDRSDENVPPISHSLALRLTEMGLRSLMPSSELAPPVDESIQVQISTYGNEPSSPPRTTFRMLSYWGLGIAMTTAAGWLVAVYWLPKKTTAPFQNEVVIAPLSDIDDVPSQEVAPRSQNTTLPDTRSIEIVESPSVPPTEPTRPDAVEPATMPDMKTNDRVAMENVAVTPKSNALTPKEEPVAMIGELVWTRLTGLVASERAQPDLTDYEPTELWSAITDSSRSFGDASERKALRLVTLPLSRAEASIQQGGRLVLAPDSMIQIRDDADVANDKAKASCTLDIEHGFVSLDEVSRGTVVDLTSRSIPIARIRWDSEATVVVGHTPQGLTLQVHSGTVSVDDESYQDSTLVLAPNTKPQPVGSAKRVPTWVDRPVDTLPISKVILAQLAESPDLLADIAQRTKTLAATPSKNQSEVRTLATLAMWQAALSGSNIARLLNVNEPEIRNAALKRLIETPNWEPRYDTMWAGTERIFLAPLATLQGQQICDQLRRGVGLEPGQTELLLLGLASRTVGQRAFCDYLLRTSLGGGPPFDPTWTGTTQLRAIAQWRRVANR